MLLATCLISSGHADEGAGLLEPLAQANPGNATALYLLGLAYTRAGKADRAKETFTKFFATAATPAQTNYLDG